MKKKSYLFVMIFFACLASSLNVGATVTDVTDTYVLNANCATKDNWTIANAGTNTPAASYNCIEFWGSANGSLYLQAEQGLTSLPNGIYRLKINAFNRSAAGGKSNVYVYANTTDKEYVVNMKTLESETAAYGSTPGTMETSSAAFYSDAVEGGYWQNIVDNILVTDGNMTIGVRNVSQLTTNGGCWTIFGNVKLYELTGADLAGMFDEVIAEANTLVAKQYTGYATLQTAITTAEAIADADIVYSDITTLKAAIKAYREASINSTDASVSTPVDATFFIKNAGFEEGSTLVVNTANGNYNEPKGWILTYGTTHTNNHVVVANANVNHAGYGTGITPTEGEFSLGCRMRWTSGSYEQISQTVENLPAGSYKISVDLGFGGTGSNAFTAVVGSNTLFTASATTTPFTTFTSNTFTINDGDDLVLTYRLDQNANTYSIVDNIKLTYYGDPLAAIRADIASQLTTLQSYNGKVPGTLYNSFAADITNAQNSASITDLATLESYSSALSADIATASGIATYYKKLDDFVLFCSELASNSTANDGKAYGEEGSLDTFEAAITAAYNSNEAATTVADIETAYATLETARQTYVQVAAPGTGYPFDYTFKVVNPNFDTNITGWTSTTGAGNNQLASNKAGDFTIPFWENWNGTAFTGKMYQTVTGLPDGMYYVKIAAFSQTIDELSSIVVYANDSEVPLTVADSPLFYITDTIPVIDGNIEFGLNAKVAVSGWVGIDNVSLICTGAVPAAVYDAAAKANLYSAITAAQTVAGNTSNVGTAMFNIPQSALTTLNSAIATAQDVYDNASSVASDYTSAISTLNTAVSTYQSVTLNAPTESGEYLLIQDGNTGYANDGKPVTWLPGRADAGWYNMSYQFAANSQLTQAFQFVATETANQYKLKFVDTDSITSTRYVCTGTVYGGNGNQLRVTTNADAALIVRIEFSKLENGTCYYHIVNTETNSTIGGYDNGFFTTNSNPNFRFETTSSSQTIAYTMTEAGYGTLILPFDASIPDGLTCYTATTITDGVIDLTTASSIAANTPYLVAGTAGNYSFTGTVTAHALTYTSGLFTGTYAQMDAIHGTYVLQMNNGVVGFYIVNTANVTPSIGANRCYLTAPVPGAQQLRLSIDNELTGINGIAVDKAKANVYSIDGRLLRSNVNTEEATQGLAKGLYIINGKKQIVK